LNAQANRKPAKATTDGKERSISPAAITRVRPSARISSGGTVAKNDM
jgi:hypothetical protein